MLSARVNPNEESRLPIHLDLDSNSENFGISVPMLELTVYRLIRLFFCVILCLIIIKSLTFVLRCLF